MSAAWRWYSRMVDRYPWRSQILQTGLLCAAGDVIAQLAVEGKGRDKFEPARVGRFFVMGSCVVCPCVRSWYLVLEKLVKAPGTRGALTKMVMDQGLFAPSFLCVFVTAASTLQGLPFSDIKRNLEATYFDIVTTNWKIWPATQLANFYFVPFKHRILVVNIVALFWNTYLAYKTNAPPSVEK